jgi:hypothetical protein
MMPINDLPVELVRHILGHCQPTDLYSLLLTCRALNVLARPLLYEDIDFSRRFIPLQLLVRTLLHCPELGTHIKHICLRGLRAYFWLNRIDLEPLAKRGSEITLVRYEDWLAALVEKSIPIPNLQTFTVLLLSYCDNLQSLSLEYNLYNNSTWMGLDIENVGRVSLPFFFLAKLHSLRAINYVSNNGRSMLPYTAPIVTRLFSLPQVQS